MLKFPELEEKVLAFWQEHKIFEKSLNKPSKQGRFVFFEGPPTANGKPGLHHVLARAFKDLIPRYKTMRGFKVERKAGWDTQGLPVELQVEKELKFRGKPDIEKYGVAKFNKKCREDVWKYKTDWEKLTKRMGFWLDLENPYVTYENYYIESLWWILKQVHQAGLLYKDYKVLPHCPRCGTALSSHEVALGYKSVTEPSVYVKFKVKGQNNTYILSWTTTPWTLPGNVALAVGSDVIYVKVKVEEEYLILAKDRLGVLSGKEFTVAEELAGDKLIGLEYEPLFDIKPLQRDKSYKVYQADFVTTTDGTGVVHTAVMYGEDDFNLGAQVGLPKYHTVDEDGNFTKDVAKWVDRFVKDKEVEQGIVADLKERGLLFRQEDYTHDYPFCWRCSTPLLYYAKPSWFIKMSALRGELKQANEKINWYPDHIKHGRFGEWLESLKDWAISRERYWGTPLPIWKCGKCNEVKVIGSVDELKQLSKKSSNKYILVRHGEAETNTKDIISCWPEQGVYNLTDNGRKQVLETAQKWKQVAADFIFSSDLLRTKQTTEILAESFGVKEINFDARLREVNFGKFNGQHPNDYGGYYSSRLEKFIKQPPGGESLTDLRARMFSFISEMESKYQKKTIVVVSHEYPLWMLETAMNGWNNLESEKHKSERSGDFINMGEAREAVFLQVPRDSTGAPDLHRPFIDKITIPCSCGSNMERVPEVADCWFDSGSMPFAQWGYPHLADSKSQLENHYPADYIAEAIDQTRGWFYTLLAVATLLKKSGAIKEVKLTEQTPPYKNVICLGHINDKNGQKMSKSKGNIVDPWEVINKFGIDALRLHLYTGNQPGEPKNFDPQSVDEVIKRTLLILMNVLAFYELYKGDAKAPTTEPKSDNILDKWILSLWQKVIFEVTAHLDKYEITEAGRKLADFVTDLSTWYVRRSRDRFKEEGSDKDMARDTLGYILRQLALALAPFMPFIAEELYQRVGGNKESVHLEDWPELKEISMEQKELLVQMETARSEVEKALAERARVGIKVRQPLARLSTTAAFNEELRIIVGEEVNVIEVVQAVRFELDTKMDDTLKAMGLVREVIRQINALRKKQGLTINDRPEIIIGTDTKTAAILEANKSDMSKGVLAGSLQINVGESYKDKLDIDGIEVTIEIVK